MAATKQTSRPSRILSPELLEGAFIEQNSGKTGNTEYRMYFPKPVMRTRAVGELGRDRCGSPIQDLSLKVGEKLQNFFGMVIDASVAEALKGQVPHIQTGSDIEERVTLLKHGIRRFHEVQEAKAKTQDFFTQYPEIKTVIADQGYVIDTGYASIPRVLLLPPSELERVETAFRTAAPEAFLRRTPIQTGNPCLQAEGLESRHPLFEEIISQLVPRARIKGSFQEDVMASLASLRPEAAVLMATVEEKPELAALLKDKAYFHIPRGVFEDQRPGTILFAEEQEAARCLELLRTIPGFEVARIGEQKEPPWVKFPKIMLTECDKTSALLLPGLAGEVNMANRRGEEQMHPRRSREASTLKNMLRIEHPDHPVFKAEDQAIFR